MADGVTAKVDTSDWDALLDKLAGPLRESLARSMAVAGGKVLRDEAKARAPIGPTNNLSNSIYLAFRDQRSTDKQILYSVSWNSSIAPHGHLVEFGYWQVHPVVRQEDGSWITNKKMKLKHPKWIAAHPFLRPALDAAGGRAKQAMIDRARQRLPELLNGQGNSDEL
jgi:hypothetical protein